MDETIQITMVRHNYYINYCCVALMGVVVFAAGCTLDGKPRFRMGSLPSSTFLTTFADPDDLGNHSYELALNEKGGVVYTCRGGHIDLDHLRGNADMTRYLVTKLRTVLLSGGSSFTFSYTGEPSTHRVVLVYPSGWDRTPNKGEIADTIAMNLAPYLTFNATTWHEILTWYGVHFVGIEPEFSSAFSWEDTYSNLLGTRLAIEAIRYTGLDFDDAMTLVLDKELRTLGVVSKEKAYTITEALRGTWFTGQYDVNMLRRNFDIGLDGSVTPTLVPDVQGSSLPAMTYPAPTADCLKAYGFLMSYEITPNVFEAGAIYADAGEERIEPAVHFPRIMKAIITQARQRGDTFDLTD